MVFVATRSAEEFEQARRRTDAVTVWGLGCHPGVAAAQRAYDADRFASLLASTAYVGEVGLDGTSRAPMEEQAAVFASVLEQMARTPRLVSVHSRRAAAQTLDLIKASGARGVILHWWLGSAGETRRALELGCLFSVNRSMDVSKLKASGVPLNSILPETDHPSGNRGGDPSQPGATLDVEQALARLYGTTAEAVRLQSWRILAHEVDTHGVRELLPPVVQAMLAHARSTSGWE
ncbi:TatD family hydrolase [Nocardioides acrostichi]|uniref:TatD family hydrolase n=1 Tax=Nocardioides acrostichi TaxID=2784339 RepID=A0A930UVF8_9ACTN|nr:TatD family hydrolase [Nocardioides acrostichi]MBF4161593.1 TatD family hydrolase [Nocardioides acrostichi]